MPRLPRIRLEGAIYYVTSRSSQNEQIFKDKDDYRMYLDLVSKYKSQHKFKLFSYSLHADHLELLIEAGDDASISDIMHDLNSLYTKYFNGRYQKRGHLFESRFKSVLVEKANYLLAVTRKMHLSSLDSPYSSFHIYTGVAERAVSGAAPSLLDISEEVKEVLGFLKSKDDTKTYERYVIEGDKKEIEALEKNLRRGQVLGSEAFQLEVKNRVQQHTEQQKEEKLPAKSNPVVVFMAGAMVLVATSSAVYLYISKQKLETKYAQVLKQKEAEFAEKTKFENRSPIGLAELDSTEWEIEKVSLPADRAQAALRDKIHFVNGQFFSEEFFKKGFKPTNISMTRQANGVVTWETIQSNADGESVSWRGDWQGDVMKGVISLTPVGQKPQDFSFFSVKWSYQNEAMRTDNAGGAQ